MKHAANFLTAARMVLALVLLAAEPLSPAFLALYTAAGITDMLDGPVARGTGARVLLAPGWTAPLTWCFLQRRLSACCLVCGPCFH